MTGPGGGPVLDPDLWCRYRIEGISTPPFRVPRTVDEASGRLPASTPPARVWRDNRARVTSPGHRPARWQWSRRCTAR